MLYANDSRCKFLTLQNVMVSSTVYAVSISTGTVVTLWTMPGRQVAWLGESEDGSEIVVASSEFTNSWDWQYYTAVPDNWSSVTANCTVEYRRRSASGSWDVKRTVAIDAASCTRVPDLKWTIAPNVVPNGSRRY